MSPARRFAFADILTVLDALPMGVLMVSPEGFVLHLNKTLALLTGYDAGYAAGKPCRHILRSRPCVSGCPLGCKAFEGIRASGEQGAYPFGTAGVAVDCLAGLDFSGNAGPAGVETNILTLKKRSVPVRLTHFPVLNHQGEELFRLDIVEDLTELKVLEQRIHQAQGHGAMIGRSAEMERVAALIPSIAPTTSPVFLTGETGTGKDILAETLHQASHRSREPFIRLNVSPLPEEMLASDIFGYMPPDAPGRPGRFQQASGGTLYITEVADIPTGIQSRLTAFLDSGNIMPVGALRETHANVRLITATNRNPLDLVSRGILSKELYHRLNVAHIHLPPLRDRKEDIDFLLRHFLDMFASRFKKNIVGFSREARALLARYDFPGNVRELKNIVEYATMVCRADSIGIDSLPAHLSHDNSAFVALTASHEDGSAVAPATEHQGSADAGSRKRKRN